MLNDQQLIDELQAAIKDLRENNTALHTKADEYRQKHARLKATVMIGLGQVVADREHINQAECPVEKLGLLIADL